VSRRQDAAWKMTRPASDAVERFRWIHDALERFETPLLRYAARLTGSTERAGDLVQETFTRLCAQDPARVRPHLARWLFTVCRNLCLDEARKERRMRPLTDSVSPASGASAPDAAAEHRDDLQRIRALLALLPEDQREVIHLKFEQGLSYAEIAQVTGINPGTVGYLLHVGLQALRSHLVPTPDAS